MEKFIKWLEAVDSAMDRLTSYCNWAVKEFKFDGFHFARGQNDFDSKNVYVRFYRNKKKDTKPFTSSFDKSIGPSVDEIVKFFNDAGYECAATQNSIGGMSVEINNI